jgi:hypothetical protein
MRSVIGRLVRFAHTTSLTGSRPRVRFASNATVPATPMSLTDAVDRRIVEPVCLLALDLNVYS